MKKALITAVVLGLIVAAFGGVSAHAKKKAKAQAVKFYFHGTEQVGEVDLVNQFGASYFPMDATEPDGQAPKSINGLTWAGDPQAWNDCAGMFTLPSWKGNVIGKISGDMTLTLHTISAPRQIEVEVWPDIGSQACASNDVSEGSYPEPVAHAVADVPAGPGVTKIVMKGVNFEAASSVLVQLTPVGPGGPRILYDAADYATSLEFKCTPTQGKSCTP